LAAVSDEDEVILTEVESERRPWREGPDEDAPRESWLGLSDDDLLHRIETLRADENADRALLEVVQSDRHFFIRQEAAKKIRNRKHLFPFEDDRHVGQILVRYLNRREDVTYLERLVSRSHHVEVRAAAQVQLAQLWGRLGGPAGVERDEKSPPPPEFEGPESKLNLGDREVVVEPAPDAEGIDGSLLGWAIHFLVEQAWAHLDTATARELLIRTHGELLPTHPVLSFFRVEADAHVHVDLSRGARIPAEAVAGVAAWMGAFILAARKLNSDMPEIDVDESTALMRDALEAVGFYAAYATLSPPDA
jgi:hypothetical protein